MQCTLCPENVDKHTLDVLGNCWYLYILEHIVNYKAMCQLNIWDTLSWAKVYQGNVTKNHYLSFKTPPNWMTGNLSLFVNMIHRSVLIWSPHHQKTVKQVICHNLHVMHFFYLPPTWEIVKFRLKLFGYGKKKKKICHDGLKETVVNTLWCHRLP